MMKKVSRNKGMQGRMMNQLGLDPSMMGGLGGAPGAGGLPGGLDPSALKGMDMKKLMEMAKKFR
jgi:signal recognition particle subunit SRP54